MSKIIQIFLIVLSVLSLSACQTVNQFVAPKGPNYLQSPKPNIGQTALYIVRSGLDVFSKPYIFINGTPFFRSEPVSFTWLTLPPGNYYIEARFSEDAELSAADFGFDITVRKGRVTYLELALNKIDNTMRQVDKHEATALMRQMIYQRPRMP